MQMIAFLLLNILLMLFVYRKMAIQRIFIFLKPVLPDGKKLDIFELIFLVAIADFLIKFATIIVKGAIYCIPSRFVLPTRVTSGKGWLYHSVELVSQLYRSLVPLGLWVRLFIQMDHWSEYIFFSILIVIAFVFKAFELKGLITRVVSQISMIGEDVHRATEVTSNRDRCPICLDTIKDARITSCMHVMCAKCLFTWCDHDRKCPICRTEIVTIPVDYRDGNTAQYLQLF